MSNRVEYNTYTAVKRKDPGMNSDIIASERGPEDYQGSPNFSSRRFYEH